MVVLLKGFTASLKFLKIRKLSLNDYSIERQSLVYRKQL
jgi:hypothetical protein